MTRRRSKKDSARQDAGRSAEPEKGTLILPPDARAGEDVGVDSDTPASFDEYASAISSPRGHDTPRTLTAVRPVDEDESLPLSLQSTELPPPPATDDAPFDDDTLGREMYGCYLASNFPDALVLAERVLERAPEHALAQLVADQCRERLSIGPRPLKPSSVLRLKYEQFVRHASSIDARTSMVIDHVDGVVDAATVAKLTGLPDAEALDRLNALVDLGVLEVVNG